VRRFFVFSIAVALLFFVLNSCSTVQKPSDAALRARNQVPMLLDKQSSDPKERTSSDQRPSWIQKQPVLEDYYVGIGHSPDTGKMGEDRKRARLDALNELAQNISVHIISEIEDRRKLRYGTYYEEIEISIKTAVDLEVQEAELVSSYHSKEDGYWVFYRLSKQEWDRIKKERMAMLEDRVRYLVERSVEDVTLSTSEKLGIISRGIHMVIDSGFAGMAKGTLFGRYGFLLDTLITEREKRLGSLALEVVPSEVILSSRGMARLTIIVSSELEDTGAMPVVLLREGTVVDRVVTDGKGIYDGEVNLSNIPYGYSTLSARVDFGDNRKNEHPPAEAEFTVYRRAAIAFIRVLNTDEYDTDSIYPSALSLFNFLDPSLIKLEYLKLDDDADFVIEFSPYFREAPGSGYNIIIAYAGASISILKDEKILFSYKTAEYKDMGLTLHQAKERAFKKLMVALKKDQVFQRRVHRLLEDWDSW
jgi:DNA-binding transcriptional ArsR family regulator